MDFVKKPIVQTLMLVAVVFLVWKYWQDNKATIGNTTTADS